MTNEAAPEKPSDKAWGFVMGWIGRTTAIVGFCATLAGGVTWITTHHRQQRERTAQLALAQTQAEQGDYQASIETCAAILKSDPLDEAALGRQLSSSELWAENFGVPVAQGQSATQPASLALDEMMPVLEPALTRSSGSRAADVQAHLGWAHWLNQHIAEREFGAAAEQNFRAALATDPANVYANAMLGNWMLQNGGDFFAAVRYLDTAAATGRARPFVRRLQIAGLSGRFDQSGARAELVRVADAMRTGGESLTPGEKRRVFGICCDVVITDRAELTESLSAVPPQHAWLTYQWLEDAGATSSSDPMRALTHDFIQASLLEISGQAPQALRQCRSLQQKLDSQPSTSLKDAVGAAVHRLSHS